MRTALEEKTVRRAFHALAGAGLLAAFAFPADGVAQRIRITGEVIDSWCYLTEIMYPQGTAHHQCAIWCAAGGIPVGILGEDGTVYIVLKRGETTRNVADPGILEIQTHKVTVDGEVITRDGMNYLLIDRIVADAGIVDVNHEDYGIQPFGE